MEASTSGAVNPKRRRGLGIVTPNACTECRKKRAKCDGQTPCGRCESQSVECVYEVPVRQSKENMRTEIEKLRSQNQQTGGILAALVTNETSEQVLQQLRDGRTIEEIHRTLDEPTSAGEHVTMFGPESDRQAASQALSATASRGASHLSEVSSGNSSSQRNVRHEESGWQAWGAGGSSSFPDGQEVKAEDMMNWESDVRSNSQDSQYLPIATWHRQSAGSTPDSRTRFARGEGQATILGSPFGKEEHQDQHYRPWTLVTNDAAFVEHLMALYFCWEYPTFASLSKEHFLEDFRSGNPRHCSSLLVNAVLALGCRFSNQPNSRSDPSDRCTSGDHFFAEATRILNAEKDRHKLTTVQALGLMSIREASCGRSSQSMFLSGQSIRIAVEMGLHNDIQVGEGGKQVEIEHAVRSATFWGALSLDQAWSLTIGRLPHFSRDLKVVTKPELVEHVEATHWVAYTDDGAPFNKPYTQPSNVRSVFKTFCELSEIVHKAMYTLYAPGTKVTKETLLESYTSYLSWYEAIPETLRLGQNCTPAVLFAHMYYHFAILLLFRPFIKLDIIGSGVSPREICSQAADAILTLVNSYSKMYTLQRTPSFVPYFVLSSSIAHLIGYGNSKAGYGTSKVGPEKLQQGIEDLREMTHCHGFADRALDIIHFLIRHWDVRDISGDVKVEESNICQPISTSLNMFCPNVSDLDIVTGLGPAQPGTNPLFWPFPLQGRPLINLLPQLEQSGFKIFS